MKLLVYHGLEAFCDQAMKMQERSVAGQNYMAPSSDCGMEIKYVRSECYET